MNPSYPVYIVSKGRWDTRLTSRVLDKMGVPYRIVIEPHEFREYSTVIEPSKILVLPFSNLGQGSIPARNWIWDHALDSGAARHWILDDNLRAFYRSNRNKRLYVGSGTVMKAAEDFVDRYENVGLAGFNYTMFVMDDCESTPPFYLNTRIYSCILVKNDLPFRWRGRFNEDTDLSLRVLKSGLATVLFNAFLVEKRTTMTMKGGNTEELYEGDGRLQMARSLVEQHPDVASITWKFKRWQHQVNYRPFRKNKLIRKPGLDVPPGINNYGMVLAHEG